jgi:disulfide bond formation protein DsbB
MSIPFNARFILLLLCIACLGALSVAYIGEYFYNLRPCMLCYYQRYGFMVATFVAATGSCLTLSRHQIYALYATGMALLVTFSIAVYQVLVEKHLIAVPQLCKGTHITATSFQDFKQGFTTQPALPPCDQVPWELFGISLAGYTAFFTLLLAMICFLMATLLLLKEKLNARTS